MALSLSRTLPLWFVAALLPFGCNSSDPVGPANPTPTAHTSLPPDPTPTADTSPPASEPSPTATPSVSTSLPPEALIPQATITTVIGTGTKGFAGDGYKGSEVKMATPWGLAMDGNDLWVADSGNARIRRYRPDIDTMQTDIGTGTSGYNGDDKNRSTVNLSNPLFAITSASGTIYVADTYANRVRKIDKTTGYVTTLAGNGAGGFSGDGGDGKLATLANPSCIAADKVDTVYIADTGNSAIRKVTSAGRISTVAGTGQAGSGVDGKSGNTTPLRYPEGILLDGAGNLYISDSGNNRIRRLAPDGIMTTVAGDGTQGFAGDGGPATKAKLSRPIGLALAADGTLYFADAGNRRIRAIAPDGTIRTVAGNGTNTFDGDGGPALQAGFGLPTWVAIDAKGSIYVSDSGPGTLDSRIRKLIFLSP